MIGCNDSIAQYFNQYDQSYLHHKSSQHEISLPTDSVVVVSFPPKNCLI